MHRTVRPLCAALLVATVAFPSFADTVKMKDGTVHEGKITSESEIQIVIDLEDLGPLPLKRDNIESIEKDTPDAETDAEPVDAKDAEAKTDDEATETEPTLEELAAEAERLRIEEERTASERLERRLSTRIVRSVKARKKADPKAKKEPGKAREATIGGRALSNVAAGTKVIVVQPPQQFTPAPEMIDIGRRQVGEMLMVGTATAWLGITTPEGVRREGLRLADVHRHVEIRSPSSHARILEGVSPGDWVLVITKDGRHFEGRLTGLASGGLRLQNPEGPVEQVVKAAGTDKTTDKTNDESAQDKPSEGENGEGTAAADEASDGPLEGPPEGEKAPARSTAGTAEVSVIDVVQLDGFLRSRNVHNALQSLEEREVFSVVRWPSGEEILGRFVALEKGRVLMDCDEDGAPDTEVHAEGPIAQVIRVPAHLRRDLKKTNIGDWMKFETIERYEDASITRIYRGKLIGVTPHAVCIEEPTGASIVHLDRVLRAERLPNNERNRLRKNGRERPASSVKSDLKVLPGSPASAAAEVNKVPGTSAITSGRKVSHVFVSAPYAGDVFGIRLGMDAVTSAQSSELDFDTIVVPRQLRLKSHRSTELISDSLEGVRITLLVDAAGNVSAMELSAR